MIRVLYFILLIFSLSAHAQFDPTNVEINDDDLSIGQDGDIFDDFNEDAEASKVLEDEQFYKYGRFFSFYLGIGQTSFLGNRGSVTEDEPPTFALGVNFFMNFRVSFTLALEYSKHNMLFTQTVAYNENNGFPDGIGLIEVNMVRFSFGTRYHIDTSDLGTALTWSNPYIAGRMEYWYQTNKFLDQKGRVGDDSGGSIGFGLGGGLEFPIILKEYYVGLEFLFHTVNFYDKYTADYRDYNESNIGINDLRGDVFSIMAYYVISW